LCVSAQREPPLDSAQANSLPLRHSDSSASVSVCVLTPPRPWNSLTNTGCSRAPTTPMAVRPILKFGQSVLHTPAESVQAHDDRLAALFVDMVDTMYAAPGIGLAAPQIGVALRVIVIDLSVGRDPSQLIQIANPVLIDRDGDQQHQEGCLSIPGFEGAPSRPARVTVSGRDPHGSERTYTADGLLARAFCHEIDHLDGLLFVDRLSPLKRDLLKRRLRRHFRPAD
jgi:peptide deformylase